MKDLGLKEIAFRAKQNTRQQVFEAMRDITGACDDIVTFIYRDGITHGGLNAVLRHLSDIVDSYKYVLGTQNAVSIHLACRRSVLEAYEFSCLLK